MKQLIPLVTIAMLSFYTPSSVASDIPKDQMFLLSDDRKQRTYEKAEKRFIDRFGREAFEQISISPDTRLRLVDYQLLASMLDWCKIRRRDDTNRMTRESALKEGWNEHDIAFTEILDERLKHVVGIARFFFSCSDEIRSGVEAMHEAMSVEIFPNSLRQSMD